MPVNWHVDERCDPETNGQRWVEVIEGARRTLVLYTALHAQRFEDDE